MKPRSILMLLVAFFVAAITAQPQIEERRNQFGDSVFSQDQQLLYPQSYFAGKSVAPVIADAPQAFIGSPEYLPIATASATRPEKLLSLYDFKRFGFDGRFSGDFNLNGKTDLLLVDRETITFVEQIDQSFTVYDVLHIDKVVLSVIEYSDKSNDNKYLLILSDKSLLKMNLLTHQIEQTLPVEGAESMLLVKTDNMVNSDVLLRLHNNVMHVIDPATLQQRFTLDGIDSSLLGAGAFTAKGQTEILLQNGRIFSVVNGTVNNRGQLNTELSRSSGRPLITDLDGDGKDELLLNRGWRLIDVISPAQDNVLWNITTSNEISTMILADINNDRQAELIYSDGRQGGRAYAMNLKTRQIIWSGLQRYTGVGGMVVGDFDNDKSLDFAWSNARRGSVVRDEFYISNISTEKTIWATHANFWGLDKTEMALADVDNDGDLDVLTLHGGEKLRLSAHNITSKTLLWQFETSAPREGDRVELIVDDFNKDGKTDIMVASSIDADSAYSLLNGKDGSLKTTYRLPHYNCVVDVIAADLDGNGRQELVTSSDGCHHLDPSSMWVLDGDELKLLKNLQVPSGSRGGMKDLVHFSFGAATDEVYGLIGGELYSYNYSDNSVKKVGSAASLLDISSSVMHGKKVLLGLNDAGQLVQLAANGSNTLIESVCSNNPGGLSAGYADRILILCGNHVIQYNVSTKQIERELNQYFGYLYNASVLRFQNRDHYLIAHGEQVDVYRTGEQASMPVPQSTTLRTHVLQTASVNLEVDGGADFFVLDGAPTLGKFTFADLKAGSLTFVPMGLTGKENISFYAVKGAAVSESAGLTIEVTNAAPVASNLNINTHWRKAVQFDLPAKDDDAEALSFSILTSPAHGTAKLLNQNGKVEYVPSGNSIESVSLSFKAADTLTESEQRIVVINLTNTKPTAKAISFTTQYETPVNGRVQAEDVDDDPLTFSVVSQPEAGSVTMDANTGLFVYQPAGDSDQLINFTYQVKDKFAGSDVQTVTIHVNGKPKSSGGNVGYIAAGLLPILWWRRRQSVMSA